MRNSRSFLERTVSRVRKGALPVVALGGLLFGGCPNNEVSNPQGQETEEQVVVKIPSSGPGSFVRNEGGQYYFTQGGEELEQGYIIVGTEEEGFLRMITSEPRREGGLLAVGTRQASLAEAVRRGSFSFKTGSSKLDDRSSTTQLIDWDGDVDKVILVGENSKIEIDGSFNLNSNFNLDFYIEGHELQNFHSSFDGYFIGDVSVRGDFRDHFDVIDESLPLGNIKYIWTGAVGYVPFVAVAELEAALRLEGDADASFMYYGDIRMRGDLKFGSEFKDGRWEKIKDHDMRVYFETTGGCFDGQATLEGILDIEADVRAYGVLGPYGKVQTLIGLEGGGLIPCYPFEENLEASLIASEWRLYGGLRVPWGVDVEIFDESIDIYNARDIFNGDLIYTFAEKDILSTELEYVMENFYTLDGWPPSGGGPGGGSGGGSGGSGGGSGGDPCGGPGGYVFLNESEPNNSESSADGFSLVCRDYIVSGDVGSRGERDYFTFNYDPSKEYGWYLSEGAGSVSISQVERGSGLLKLYVTSNKASGYPREYEVGLVNTEE